MTANDSDVSDGDILTGSQVVRVYGENLTTPFVTLTFGDVEYIPFNQGEGYIEYILDDNGTASINVDGNPIMSFEVEGVVVPEGFPTDITVCQKSTTSTAWTPESQANSVTYRGVNCINYPYRANEDYPYFRIVYNLGDANVDDFSFDNCTLRNTAFDSQDSRIIVAPNNVDGISVIRYKGFIISVFNYTTD